MLSPSNSAAPTATGKSFIGCEVIRSPLKRGKPGPHAYLVPFRCLAGEVCDLFHDLLGSTNVRLHVSTGDHREPMRPEESDLIVATYESFAALVRRTGLAPGTVIADEIHLIADDYRGPVVEGLLLRLLASRLFVDCRRRSRTERTLPSGSGSNSWRAHPKIGRSSSSFDTISFRISTRD